jgi:hypothetical protein
MHASVLYVSPLPQRHHGCLKNPGIRKQSEQGDLLGVLALCCHLFGHYVNLVGSLDGGQVCHLRSGILVVRRPSLMTPRRFDSRATWRLTGGATTTAGSGAQTGDGTTTTGAGWPITTPGRGIPIPMFKRTLACEAATAPNNTAESNNIRFIQQVRRSTEATCCAGGSVLTRFYLNKRGGLASVVRSEPGRWAKARGG